eukprot:m51a1_g3294 putative alpha-centractin (376) ;mRNA; f:282857-284493
MSDTILTNQPLVIDTGSCTVKAGLAGADEPRCVFNAIVGTPKHKRVMAGSVEGAAFVGSRADELRGLLKLRRPIAHSTVADWPAVESIWRHVYTELRLQSDEHPVLLTEAPLGTWKNRERTAEVFFETLKTPALYFASEPILSLYASGRTTGLVLGLGDGVMSCVPVVEGFAVQNAIMRSDIAGREVTEYLELLMRRAGTTLRTSAEREIARHIKESACYVALDPIGEEASAATSAPGEYAMPDGSIIQVGPERFRAPEVLFRPDIIGEEALGVHDLAAAAIAKSDVDLRTSLWSNILLSGGSTLFPNFGKRLLNELKSLAPKDTKIRIVAPPERVLSAWIGGSLIASLNSFKKLWVSKQEYEEKGAGVLHQKVF